MTKKQVKKLDTIRVKLRSLRDEMKVGSSDAAILTDILANLDAMTLSAK